MNELRRKELVPVIVLLLSSPVGGVVVAVCAALYPDLALHMLVGLTVFGGLAIRVGDWPPIEYGLLLLIGVVLGLLLIPISPMGVAIAGAIVGYLWGGWGGSILDRPNVERLTREARSVRESDTHDQT